MSAYTATMTTTPQRNRVVGSYPQTPGPAQAQAPATLAVGQPPVPSAATANAEAIIRAQSQINVSLNNELKFPELETSIAQGVSAEYDLPTLAAWKPFQSIRNHAIPENVLEQANLATVSTRLGVIAEIQHAFIAIDSSLYLWNYTEPNPELIGYEEQTSAIMAVKLVKPRKGVFNDTITHLLVVATVSEIILIAVAAQKTPAGSWTMALYSTRMTVPIRGIAVHFIEGSSKTGRIFFGGRENEDVWELTYQQQENWFTSRCQKINHTNQGASSGLLQILPSVFGGQTPSEHIVQMTMDDTRDLLYTLSSKSTIRVWHLKTPKTLVGSLTRTYSSLQANIAHMMPRTELFDNRTRLVSISPIPATESSRLSLQALTTTGCRIFLSTTSGAFHGGAVYPAPNSMQVHHVRLPPKDPSLPDVVPQTQGTQVIAYPAAPSQMDLASRYLSPTTSGERYPPGFSLCVVEGANGAPNMFLSAPDSGRIKSPRDATQATKYPEFGQWIELGYPIQGIGQVTPSFSAASQPQGFANELAVQFDQSPTEIAILTTTGVQTIRRRRLVDIFAAAIRQGGDKEGRDGEVRRFIRYYGRSETAATALAVACGQGSEVGTDNRVASITDPDVIEFARATYIEHGGKPMLNENSVLEGTVPAIDNVRPSPRHEGTALYISRLVRSIWTALILKETLSPTGGLVIVSTIPSAKLQEIQRALNSLQEFLQKTKSSIEGLSGPDALGRVSTKQEEVALQGEHRAMTALVHLVKSMIEGIAFVLVLFDERVSEIILSLPQPSIQEARRLTYESLFCMEAGRILAKTLVRAIVNRNIVNGSNVDTVAEALRRRCGSFCSADDVVIFKAQELVTRAAETGATTEAGRMILNESMKLFQKVAAALTREQLRTIVEQYTKMEFYAGAIQLSLEVAQKLDPANRALSWVRDGSPKDDNREGAFESKHFCYILIHGVIEEVDKASAASPAEIDGRLTVTAKRAAEAYDVIDNSQDEVFQTNLYDWYMKNNRSERLLDLGSPYVVAYLRRGMDKDPAHADLLWRYFAHHHNYMDAASVQLLLAKGGFAIDLETRIGYLSRARTNASIRTTSLVDAQQSRQQLLREINDLLDVANIQDDILQRMSIDQRLNGERRLQVLKSLNGEILQLGELFNQYADQANYYDVCILIYNVADHRNPADIASSWQALIDQVHDMTLHGTNEDGQVVRSFNPDGTIKEDGSKISQPWEAVASRVRKLGLRLHRAEATFPIPILLPMLETYSLIKTPGEGDHWVLDLFLELEAPHEVLLPVLEQMYHSGESPWDMAPGRALMASELVYLIGNWYITSERRGEAVAFGSEDTAAGIEDVLKQLLREPGLQPTDRETVEVLRARIAAALR